MTKTVSMMLGALLCAACLGPEPGVQDCLGPADCAPLVASTCSADCPGAAELICVARSCEAVPRERAAASADVMLHFSLTGKVQSLIYAWLDPRRAEAVARWSCEELQALPRAMTDPRLNVLASGFVNFQATQGTAFFPDANLGQVPQGERILIAEGRDQARGDGAVVARGCVQDLSVSAGHNLSLSVQLDPL